MSSSCWSGNIQARELPSNQTVKPIDCQLDPAELKCSDDDFTTQIETAQSMPASFDPDPRDNEIKLVLSFTLRHNDQHVYIEMSRQCEELAMRTIQRMQMSLLKRLKISSGDQRTTSIPFSLFKICSDEKITREVIEIGDSTLIENLMDNSGSTVMVDLGIKEIEALPITYNAPLIVQVETFGGFKSACYDGIPVVVRVRCLFAEQLLFRWFIDGKCVQAGSPCFTPKVDHIGKSLSVKVSACRHTDNIEVTEGYGFRLPIQRRPRNGLLELRTEYLRPRSKNDGRLRIVSYNVLSDINCSEEMYPYCQAEALCKYRRMQSILHEIISYQADVACLQEMTRNAFETLFFPVLQALGFDGYLSCKQRTRNVEGCALFWKSSRLRAERREDVVLGERFGNLDPTDHPEVKSLLHQNVELREYLLEKLGHVGQIVVLTDLCYDRTVAVANTHLYFHSRGNHIRSLQMWSLCASIAKLLPDVSNLVVCGDFNSSLVSPAGKLLADGCLEANCGRTQRDLNVFKWGMKNSEQASYNPLVQTQHFPALSLPDGFPRMIPTCPTPFTTMVDGFQGCLDHIMATNTMDVLSSCTFPTFEAVREETALPSTIFPSDHFSLVCDIDATSLASNNLAN